MRRWIAAGKLTATKIDGVWSVSDQVVNDLSDDQSNLSNDQAPEGSDQSAAVADQLRSENEYLKERIQELESARERSDTIILQLTRQLEQSQRLLEHHQESRWRRWFRRGRKGERE